MPSTFSPSLRIDLIPSGTAAGEWGNITNDNLEKVIEQAIAYTTSVDVTSGNVTLTSLNGVPDQARSAVLEVTGTPGVTRVITVPNVQKTYTVRNRTANIAQIKTASGTAFDCPALSDSYLVCDGLNGVVGRSITDGANAITSLASPFTSPAFTGVPTAPTAVLGTNTTQLATTAFVQNAAQSAIQLIYPVGSVYINASVTTSPATLLGFGTWSAIGAGRVLVGQDTGDALFDTMGETGGSKDAIVVTHTHTTASVSTADLEHSHSGTTNNQSANHNHGSGTLVNEAVGDHVHGIAFSERLLYNGGGGNPNTAFGGAVNQATQAAGAHNHTISGSTGDNSANHNHTFDTGDMSANSTHSHTVTLNNEGASGTNANVQPYLVVKMWQRTA
jgi:hypothetical protein